MKASVLVSVFRKVGYLCYIVFSLLISSCFFQEEASVYVLLYHSFFGNPEYSTDLSIGGLKEQMDELVEQGFSFVSFQDLKWGRISGSRNILVTIDDGNRSCYDAYYQVFKPMGIKPVLALYTSPVGRKDFALTREKVRELAEEGCTIASHSVYHTPLTERLYRYDRSLFHREIYDSKAELETLSGSTVEVFMYPYGTWSESAAREVKKAGYTCAFILERGSIKSPLRNNEDLYRLNRYMYNNNWKEILEDIERDIEKRSRREKL